MCFVGVVFRQRVNSALGREQTEIRGGCPVDLPLKIRNKAVYLGDPDSGGGMPDLTMKIRGLNDITVHNAE